MFKEWANGGFLCKYNHLLPFRVHEILGSLLQNNLKLTKIFVCREILY